MCGPDFGPAFAEVLRSTSVCAGALVQWQETTSEHSSQRESTYFRNNDAFRSVLPSSQNAPFCLLWSQLEAASTSSGVFGCTSVQSSPGLFKKERQTLVGTPTLRVLKAPAPDDSEDRRAAEEEANTSED